MLMFTWNGERWAILGDDLWHYDWENEWWEHATPLDELRSVH